MNKTENKNKKLIKLDSDHKLLQSEKIRKSIENLELSLGNDTQLEKWTFRRLKRAINNKNIIVDKEFQRDEVYKVPQKSSLIDSALKGIYIAPLFAYEERDENGQTILSIIDGQQRLTSVRDFMNNRLELSIPFGEYSMLNGFTYDQIQKINPDLADQIGDRTLDIAVARNITKDQAQEYFSIINTSTVSLSPGEVLRGMPDPVKTILKQIVNSPYFKIKNLRKSRKGEYVVATKLLWNHMFNDPIKHEFVGNSIKTFVDYFNSVTDVELLEYGRDGVLELLELYSEITDNCQFSPRTQGDIYATLCFLSLQKAKGEVNIEHLQKFINWLFRGINKQIYPYRLRDSFDKLSHHRVKSNGHTSAKEFVILLSYLYKEERKAWLDSL